MPTENRSSNTEMVSVAPEAKRQRIYVEVRKCDGCNHIGIDDAHKTLGACHECGWSGPEPVEDKCPSCKRENVIAAACPECGSRYVLEDSKEFEMPAPQPHAEPIAWMVGTAIWWTKEAAERDAAATGLPVVPVGPIVDTTQRLRAALKFYADREHYHFESGNWDTVSGEPQNILWCSDEPDFIEDGSVARSALEQICTPNAI